MVSTISFIQANLQHSIVASGILTRTVSVEGVDVALVQEPWYREDCIRGLTVPGYTLYSAGGKERPRACILARKMHAWALSDFSYRDLVAIQMKCLEDGAERRLVVCSAYLPYDSEDRPPSREMGELVRYCEQENLRIIVGCESNAHHTAWGSPHSPFWVLSQRGRSKRSKKRRPPHRIWRVPFLLFRPTCNMASLLLEFLPEQ